MSPLPMLPRRAAASPPPAEAAEESSDDGEDGEEDDEFDDEAFDFEPAENKRFQRRVSWAGAYTRSLLSST
jgi:hypothetical protein